MVEKIYNFYKGYVKIRLKSSQIERFLNLSVNKNIYIWDVERISENEIFFCVSAKGFKKLREAVYETGSKVKILGKKGFFRYIFFFRRRKLFLYGGILCGLFILFISSLILDIEIKGNERVSTDIILQKLDEIDLKKFAFRSNIDSDRISLSLINGTDSISWVGVTEKGCRLIIEIKERTPPPQMLPLDIPCHIVAKKDGIIYKMNVENGEAQIALNQVVTEGQLLVSGIINTKYDGMRYVHSMAEIIAKTWYEKFTEVKLYEYTKQFTGEKIKRYSVKIFGKNFDLSFGEPIPYYNSDKITKRKVIGFLEILTTEYREYILIKQPLTEEEAIEKGKNELLNELSKDYNKEQIKNTEFQISVKDEDTRVIRMLANTEEEIGKSLEIRKDTI